MDKRGFELALNTIVIMILAFLLLVAMIFFFTSSSKGFMDTIKSYISYSNVDSVIEGCNIMVDSASTYNFCCEQRDVKYYLNGEKTDGMFSCDELSSQEFIGGKINMLDCSGMSC